MKKRLKVLLIIFCIVFLGASITLLYIKYFNANPFLSINAAPSPTVATTQTPISDPGVTWINPKELDDLGLLVSIPNDRSIEAVSYYKVANLDSGGEIDLAIVQWNEPRPSSLYRFKKDADGVYHYLAKHSAEQNYPNIINNLSKKVEFDPQTAYQSLTLPEFLPVSGANMRLTSNSGLFSELDSPESIGETHYGKIYRLVIGNPTAIGGFAYPIKLADGTYRSYVYKYNFVTDDNIAKVTWADNTGINSSKYTSESYVNCGTTALVNEVVNAKAEESKLVVVGTTSTNEKVYTVGADDPIMQAAYENYKTGRNTNVDPITTFATRKPIFIWKSPLNDYVVFTGSDFKGLAECGGPIVQ